MDKNIESYLKVYEALDEDLTKKVLVELRKSVFEKHKYHDPENDTYLSYDDDLYIAYNLELTKRIEQKIWSCVQAYLSDLDFSWFNSYQGFTEIRYNKYIVGTNMKVHCDHIHTIFDGSKRGIPILSVLGCLNNDYEGGELIFFGDKRLVMNPGDVVVFPSNFLYPHCVMPVTKGTRYSFVSWAW